MLELIGEVLTGIVFELALAFVWWILLFPVVWAISMPFILVLAGFSREPYWTRVSGMFYSVNCFWRDWGFFLTPL